MKKIIFYALAVIFVGCFLAGCISAREQQNPQPKKLREIAEWDCDPTPANALQKARAERIEF